MLAKTHLAIGVFASLFFLPHVNHPWIFVPVVILASILPDIDSGFSTLGRSKIFRPFQMVSKHRGIFHSFTFCILIGLVFALYIPILAFAFFLGYALHLIADSWTPEGIKPFWPLKEVISGKVKVGGVMEESVFIVFALLDVIFLFLQFV